VFAGVVTLREIDEHYTLEDIQIANEIQESRETAERAEAEKLSRHRG
jgi:hypothetical protein